MKRLVLDASVVLKWFTADGERHLEAARSLRAEYEAGRLTVIAPRLLWTELLEATARATGWPSDRLVRVAAEIDRLGFELRDPPVTELAGWVARGLTGAEAAYAAVASADELSLVTDDERLLRLAATVARPLA
ncbi:MAG: PIN domain-containing protein [Candidatus Limnocylindria bacterium]